MFFCRQSYESKIEEVSLSLLETAWLKIGYLLCIQMVSSCLNPAYLDDPSNVTIPSASITLASFVFLVAILSHDPVEITITTSPPSDIGIVDKAIMLCFLFILISIWILIIYGNSIKSVPHASSKDIQTLPCRRWTQEKYNNRIPGDVSTGIIHPGFHSHSNHDILLECVICLENFAQGDVVVTLPCDHDFHKACVYYPRIM
jgi:hypothetical protein